MSISSYNFSDDSGAAQRQQHRRYQRRGRMFSLCGVLLMLALILSRVAFSGGGVAQAASVAPLLPGETLWSGVPSFDFGANDAYDWAGASGFDQSASIQSQVKSAHVPLVRAWFPEYPNFASSGTAYSDAHQLAIAQAVTGTGTACMAVIYQTNSVNYDLHLVSLLAPYCRYFEVGNEPDYSGMHPMTVSAYLAWWNSFVPQARALDPTASYGGPALATEFGLSSSTYMQQVLQGMAASGIAPDFVTFHWYICSGLSSSSCLTDTPQWTPTHGKTVFGWLQTYFPGHNIPLGITEWSADPGNPSWAYDDSIMSQFEQEALASFEQNPYLSFLTQYDLASYAGYGSLDMFRTFSPETSSIDYSNTSSAIGAARPMFGVLASEIARLSASSPGSGSTPTPTPTQPPSPTPSPTSNGVPSYDHVITVLEENHSYGDIIGSSSAPYINNTLLADGALATNYTANVQSSLPNYLALFGGSTLGLTSNCEPGPGCESNGPSIASEVMAAGKTWRAYEENMTAPCQNVVDGGLNNLYTVHHNPAPYYTGIASSCQTNDVNYSQLATDLQSPASLPAYVFVTPNLDDDMHNGTVSQGDTWLSQQIPVIQHSPACQQSRCLIAITWDEGSYSSSGAPLSPQVATIFLGPGVQAGGRDATAYTHYNLLRTEEEALGLPTMTANDAAALPMLGMFTSGSGTPTPTPTPIPPMPTPNPSPTPSPSPSPSPTPTPTGTLFSDTFEQDAVGSLPTGWTISSGTWTIANDGSHVLRETTSPQAASYVWVGSDSWTDYTLTASVKPDPSDVGGTYNLMGRYLDVNNHYSLILKNGDEWWLGVKHMGTWTTLANGTYPYTSQWYMLALTFSGSKITASINGKALATVTDTTFAAGAIGFNTNAAGELDNVSVVGAGTPVPTPSPSPTPSPTPSPVPTMACAEVVSGALTLGQCSGTFTPGATSGGVACIEVVNGAMVAGQCSGTFTKS